MPDNVLTFRTDLPSRTYPEPTQLEDFRNRVLAGLEREPGVTGVAVETRVVDRTPVERGWGFETDGRTPTAVEAPPLAAFAVSPGYFAVKETRIVEGRGFTALDRAGAAPVAIVNEELAQRFWPGGSAVGRAIRLGDETSGAVWHTIVGVIEDVRQPTHTELTEIPSSVYLPIEQNPSGELLFLVRTSGEPVELAPAVRRVVSSVDAGQPVQAIRTMRAVLFVEAFVRAAMAALLNLFGAVGLGLAVLGIYGVISYAVSLRTREIAIRVGLGARAGDVLRLIMQAGMRLVGMGVLIGLFGAWALTRVIASMLDDIHPSDPLVLGAVVLLLGGVGLLACWVPARRATRIQPMDALRAD